MTCDDFLTTWNARTDDPESFAIDRAEILDAHATSCDHCRRLSSGFRMLMQGLPAPPVPDGLSHRVLAAWAATECADRRNTVLVRWGLVAGLAAAAVALAMFAPWTPRTGRVPVLAAKPKATAGNLSSALARATSATLDLAREASAPAARLGQDVYVAGLPREIAWPMTIEPTAAQSEMLQSVSRKVSSGVGPLSGSARRAFSFLLAPAPGAAGRGSAKNDAGA